MLPDPCANKAEAEFRPVGIVHGDEYYMVTGLEGVLASVGRGETYVDTFVDTTKNTVSDYVFHECVPPCKTLIHHIVVFYKFLHYRLK
jgi:hypothetical protein